MKNFIIDSIIESTKYDTTHMLEFFCVVTDKMKLPDNVRENYPNGSGIVLVLNHFNDYDAAFDFKTGMVSWVTTFGGIPFTLEFPFECVLVVSDQKGTKIAFEHTQEYASSNINNGNRTIEKTVPEKSKKPKLELVSDNVDFAKTPPRGFKYEVYSNDTVKEESE